MANSLKISKSYTVGGKTFTENRTLSGEDARAIEKSIPAAKTGTLTTRTNTTQGVITLAGGHGITTGVVSVFWDGGSRHGVSATIATNACTITGGGGDDLPIATTPVTVMKIVTIEMTIDTANLLGVVCSSPVPAHFCFATGDHSAVNAFRIQGNNQVESWIDGSGAVDDMIGEAITEVQVTHGSTAAQILKIGILGD